MRRPLGIEYCFRNWFRLPGWPFAKGRAITKRLSPYIVHGVTCFFLLRLLRFSDYCASWGSHRVRFLREAWPSPYCQRCLLLSLFPCIPVKTCCVTRF